MSPGHLEQSLTRDTLLLHLTSSVLTLENIRGPVCGPSGVFWLCDPARVKQPPSGMQPHEERVSGQSHQDHTLV